MVNKEKRKNEVLESINFWKRIEEKISCSKEKVIIMRTIQRKQNEYNKLCEMDL